MDEIERQREEAERRRRKAEMKAVLDRTEVLRAAVQQVAEHYRNLPRPK